MGCVHLTGTIQLLKSCNQNDIATLISCFILITVRNDVPSFPQKIFMCEFLETVNMFSYMAKRIKAADGIKVANQLILKLGDYTGLPGYT